MDDPLPVPPSRRLQRTPAPPSAESVHAFANVPDRLPLLLGTRLGETVVRELSECPVIRNVETAGEVRRHVPETDGLDLVAQAESGEAECMTVWLADHAFRPLPQSAIPAEARPHVWSVHVGSRAVEGRTVQVRLFLAGAAHIEAARVFTTGDELHNQALAALLAQAFPDRTAPATGAASEEAVYRMAGLPFVPPELREGFSMTQDTSRLLTIDRYRGDLHTHTTASDGTKSAEEMVRACRDRGYSYMAITDHSPSLRVAHGLSPERLRAQRAEIARLRTRYPDMRIYHGTEVDILGGGRLDFADEILAGLDIVVASIHMGLRQNGTRATERLLAAVGSPFVHILGHPSGRMLGRREPYPFDAGRVLAAAAQNGVAVECNANPNRLDLDPVWLRQAVAAGCLVAVNSDGHSLDDLERVAGYGITNARKGWVPYDRVINTWGADRLETWLRRTR